MCSFLQPFRSNLPTTSKPAEEPKYQRKRLLVDRSFQLRLLLRLLAYAVLCTLITFHASFMVYVFTILLQDGPSQGVVSAYVDFLYRQQGLFWTLVMLAPMVLYDLLKFSNRIAGPLYRCRRVMREMAAGSAVPVFKPREHDLMADFFKDFNALIGVWNEQLASRSGAALQNPTTGASREKQPAELTQNRASSAVP